jgi:Caspase domain
MWQSLWVVFGLLLQFQLSDLGAQTTALLVGVSGYPSLPEHKRLKGPANDVLIMREALLKAGMAPSSVTTLADGVLISQGLPTRKNILTQLRQIGERVPRGEWLVVYFSGHGSQQPQSKAALSRPGVYIEPDGLDEIFLPYDVGRWSGSLSTVEGAIIDDEFGEIFKSILARGVQLWAIFDTCHSGDMAKAADIRPAKPIRRFVSPSEVGVPDALRATPISKPKVETSGEDLRIRRMGIPANQLVIFYASHPDEPAAEELLAPPEKLSAQLFPNRDKRYFGLFTYAIAQEIPTWVGSFKQLSSRVAEKYKSRPYPTPIFEGDLDKSQNIFKPSLTSLSR